MNYPMLVLGLFVFFGIVQEWLNVVLLIADPLKIFSTTFSDALGISTACLGCFVVFIKSSPLKKALFFRYAASAGVIGLVAIYAFVSLEVHVYSVTLHTRNLSFKEFEQMIDLASKNEIHFSATSGDELLVNVADLSKAKTVLHDFLRP